MSLEVRKKLKARKPTFMVQDSHKHKKIRQRWRKPRGSDSKIRQGFRGYHRAVEHGWKSPRDVRGFHPLGLAIVMVHTIKDIDSIDTKKQGACIASAVGTKKKLQMIELLQKKKITILNFKDANAYVTDVQKKIEEKKSKKKVSQKIKEEKKTKKIIKEEKKDNLSKTITEEEKKQQEKKEKDKILTKAQ